MARVVRRRAAEHDPADIFDYGCGIWGPAAAMEYVEGFGTVWDLLARHPRAGGPEAMSTSIFARGAIAAMSSIIASPVTG